MAFIKSTAFMFGSNDEVIMSGVPEDGNNMVSMNFKTVPKSIWKFVGDDGKKYAAVFPGVKDFTDDEFIRKLPGELMGDDIDGKSVVAILAGSEGKCRGMAAFIQHA